MAVNNTMISLSSGIYKLRETLEEVKQRCIYSDECVKGGIGVTEDPHIDTRLFNKICKVLKDTEGL